MVTPLITVTRLYTGSDNESHFEDIQVPLKNAGGIGCLSQSVELLSNVVYGCP